MSTEKPELKSLLEAAAAIESDEERAAFVREQCGEDRQLREQLERLLAQDQQQSSWGEMQSGVVEETIDVASPVEGEGEALGNYKLLQQIGEGGFGLVYMAEQHQPVRRKVAVKVIKPGMDSKEVIGRFEAERQALAMMDHPNIAQVLDAGVTESGRPYFVMELVRGIPITEYCDRERMGTQQRLKLFITVCNAVQHAHQKGVIHRDIKPSNVLVTEHDGLPVPKVIDFGVAKAVNQQLTEHTVFTRFHQMIGTPMYMSPEQAALSGLDVDTRSDIYSLGVLLYELLTGTTPFNKNTFSQAAYDEIRRIIREEEPSKPSTKLRTLGQAAAEISGNRDTDPSKLGRILQGDLDWVVMKCLEKDRKRRYETANGLASEIRRHLDNEPVNARPPSVGYRFQKLWRRNRRAVAFGVSVLSALLIGLTLATVAWQRAEHNLDLAQRATADADSQRKQAQASAEQARHHRQLALTAKEEARQRAYAAEVNLGFQALSGNNLHRARDLLSRQLPRAGETDLRGFEWRYLWNLCRGDHIAVFGEKKSAATDAEFSPDGKLVALAADGKTLVFDVTSRKLVATLPGHCLTLSFSPTHPLLATANLYSGKVVIWDTRTWTRSRSLPKSSAPVLFSPDGKWLATAGRKGICLWDTQTWTEAGRSPPGSARFFWQIRNCLDFSPDSKRLCMFSVRRTQGTRITMWEIPQMKPVAGFKPPPLQPSAVMFLPDGKHLLIGQFIDGSLKVLDAQSGKVIASRREHQASLTVIDAAADAKTFVTASADRTIVVWDASTFEPRTLLRGNLSEVWALGVSPDGSLLVSGSQDGSSMLWNPARRRDKVEFEGTLSGGFVEDGRYLLTMSNAGTGLLDLVTGRQQLLFLPGKKDGQGAAGALASDDVSAIAFPSNSKSSRIPILVGRENGSVELWSASSSKLEATLAGMPKEVAGVAFSSDGKMAAAVAVGGELRIWRISDRREVARMSTGESHAMNITFSPDDRQIACGGRNQYVEVWDVQRPEQPPIKLGKHRTWVRSLCFSPDGRSLATGTVQGNNVFLWDLSTRQKTATLRGHLQDVSTIAFSPDGRTMATGGGDAQVILWSSSTKHELLRIPTKDRVVTVRFSPAGRVLSILTTSAPRLSISGHRTRLIRAASWEDIKATEVADPPE